jgi:hypothetical protein
LEAERSREREDEREIKKKKLEHCATVNNKKLLFTIAKKIFYLMRS